jgi:hypothetical protein
LYTVSSFSLQSTLQSHRLLGGGNRTRVFDGATSSGNNELRQCPAGVAALWLQLQDTDEHELARIGTIIEEWPALPEHIKLAVEALCRPVPVR